MSKFSFGDIFHGNTQTSSKNEVNPFPQMSFNGVFGLVNHAGDDIRVGGLVRAIPFPTHMLEDAAIIALAHHLKVMGVSDAVPKIYEKRLKRNIEKGLVSQDGMSFTEKGAEVATQHLMRNGYSLEDAKQKAKEARAWKHDKNRAKTLEESNNLSQKTDLKFSLGYGIDKNGRTFAEEKAILAPITFSNPNNDIQSISEKPVGLVSSLKSLEIMRQKHASSQGEVAVPQSSVIAEGKKLNLMGLLQSKRQGT